jgi:hypothetical protein
MLTSKYKQYAYREDANAIPSIPPSVSSSSARRREREHDEDDDDESPERVRIDESLLSPDSELKILTSISHDITLNSTEHKPDGMLSFAPQSPLQTLTTPQYIPSPMRLLELASICEER